MERSMRLAKSRAHHHQGNGFGLDTQLLQQLCAVASMIFIGLIVAGAIGVGPKYSAEILPPGGPSVAVNIETPSR